jgi:hypothetical protein
MLSPPGKTLLPTQQPKQFSFHRSINGQSETHSTAELSKTSNATTATIAIKKHNQHPLASSVQKTQLI